MRNCYWLAAWLLVWPVLALSQPLPPAVVAVIDYQRVLNEADAAHSIRDQIEARRQRYQDQIAKEERRLHDADRELEGQRSLLQPDAFAQKRQAFEKDVAAVQRMVQDRRRELDEMSAEAFAVIRNNIIEIVGQLAEDREFNVVLPSSGVLLFAPQIDLTEDVLGQLNENLPDVRVPESAAN